MEPDLKQLIISLSSLMSVSGHTMHDGDKLCALVGDYFDEIRTTPIGNYLFIRRCGRSGAPKILIDTHYDEIGMIVTGIREGGFLTFTSIGGLDTRILQAGEVTVYGKNGRSIYGVIGSTPPHLQKPGESGKLREIGDLLIDTGYSTSELEKFVRVGTPVGFRPKYTELKNGMITGKGFDNKSCGAAAVAAIAGIPADSLWGDVYLQFATFEEAGGYMPGAATGAFAVEPDCALVADVNLGRTPDTKKVDTVEVGGGASLTFSPLTDRKLTVVLRDAAKAADIKVQPCVAATDAGTDANIMGLVGRGIPTVDVGLPLKSMHTCTEAILLSDAEALRDLIRLFITSDAVAQEVCNG